MSPSGTVRALIAVAMLLVLTARCLGSSSPAGAPGTATGGPKLGGPAWLVTAASREAVRLGDPTVTSALVGPITAGQARVVFQGLRRSYPEHAYLLVLRGAFVTPRIMCPEDAWGCPGYAPAAFTEEVTLLTRPAFSQWQGLAIAVPIRPAPHIPFRLRRIHFAPHPSMLPTGPLLRLAIAQALAMHATRMRNIGFAPLTATQAVRLFGASHRAGYLVLETGLFHNPPPAFGQSKGARRAWFRWAAIEYAPGSTTAAAFRSLPLPCSAVYNHRIEGIHVTWIGVPYLFPHIPRHFYAAGPC